MRKCKNCRFASENYRKHRSEPAKSFKKLTKPFQKPLKFVQIYLKPQSILHLSKNDRRIPHMVAHQRATLSPISRKAPES